MAGDRKTEFLEHLARYRVTTVDVVANFFYADVNDPRGAAKSTATRLLGEGLIGSAKLYPEGNEVYYFLLGPGAIAIGLPEKQAGPSKGSTLLQRFAALHFCCDPQNPRPRFIAEEFEWFFPGVWQQGMFGQTYYLDVDAAGVRRLGRVLTDTQNSDPLGAFTLKKAVKKAEAMLPRFVAEGRFAFAVVTGTQGRRAKNLARRAPAVSSKTGIPIRVAAYADLTRLLLATRPQRSAKEDT